MGTTDGNFSSGQHFGVPNNKITDYNLATSALFLHRCSLFERLIEKEYDKLSGDIQKKYKKVSISKKKRDCVKNELKKFTGLIIEFEKDEGCLWVRDTIAHSPITHGFNMGVFSFKEPGYSGFVTKTEHYFDQYPEGRNIPFSTIERLSKDMIRILIDIGFTYNPINKRDKDEYDEVKKNIKT